jgi:hypothetical protein
LATKIDAMHQSKKNLIETERRRKEAVICSKIRGLETCF